MSVEAQIQTHKEFKFTLTLREVKSDDDGVGIGSKQKAKLSFRASIMSVDGRPIGVCKGKERIGYPDERLPVRRFLDARIDSLRDMEVSFPPRCSQKNRRVTFAPRPGHSSCRHSSPGTDGLCRCHNARPFELSMRHPD